MKDLPADTDIDIPFWLAKMLFQKNFASIDTPKWFTENFRCIVEADPNVSNLKDKSMHFYDFGIKIAELLPYSQSMFNLIGGVFFHRMKALFDLVSHLKESEPHDLLNKLTDTENRFYSQARKSVRNFRSQKVDKNTTMSYNEAQRKMMRNRKRLKLVNDN